MFVSVVILSSCGSSRAETSQPEVVAVAEFTELAERLAQDTGAMRTAALAQQDVAAECMAARGFELVRGPVPSEDSLLRLTPIAETVSPRWALLDMTEDDLATGFRIWEWLDLLYGSTDLFVDPWPTIDLDGNPNEISGPELEYDRNLQGYEVYGKDGNLTAGSILGCNKIAARQYPSSAYQHPAAAEVGHGWEIYLARFDVAEAVNDWHLCMLDRGYDSYPTDPSRQSAEMFILTQFPDDAYLDALLWEEVRLSELQLAKDYLACIEPSRRQLSDAWIDLFGS